MRKYRTDDCSAKLARISKTLAKWDARHPGVIADIDYESGYYTPSGKAYDVLLERGWCDGDDPFAACHTLIHETVAATIAALNDVRRCNCAECCEGEER